MTGKIYDPEGFEVKDVVEIVRCKDCIAFDSSRKLCKRYGGMAFSLDEDDYCSLGERREE